MKRLILLLLFSTNAMADKTCSRIAIVNYQEILVDTSSSNKGDGLKFYLEKDPVSKKYFEKYKNEARPKWLNASIGTLGTAMILGGFFTQKDPGNKKGLDTKETLVLGGVTTLLLNYLIAKTYDYANESNLDRAVKEYNKRNLPKIYFNPFKNDNAGGNDYNSYGISTGITTDF